ncbi:MAG: hypothetical protein ACYC2P_10650 [Paludibacteraceae bacterium]
MKKVLIIVFLLFEVSVSAQTDRIDSLLNDLIFSDENLLSGIEPVNSDFLYAGLNFNNKTFFAGREIGADLINVSGHIYYFNRLGFFAGSSGVWYDQLTPGYTTTVLTLGYGLYLDKNKQFRASGSYSRFIYNSDTTAIYPYENNANLTLSFRKNWYGARISNNLLFGSESLYTVSPSIFASFNFWNFGKNNKFHLGPEISCYFTKETINLTSIPEEKFGLLNTQFYVPLSLNLRDFELQFGYSLNFPFTRDNNVSYRMNSAFSVSTFYLIPL